MPRKNPHPRKLSMLHFFNPVAQMDFEATPQANSASKNKNDSNKKANFQGTLKKPPRLDGNVNAYCLEENADKQNLIPYPLDIKKNIYNLSWEQLYELGNGCSLTTLLKKLHCSKKVLYLSFARSNHGFDRFNFEDFKNLSKNNFHYLFRQRITILIKKNPTFNPRNNSLASLHYFFRKYPSAIDMAAYSLGFWSRYSLIAFLSCTNLKLDIKEIALTPINTLKQKFAENYDKPLKTNEFIRFNYSLKELNILLNSKQSITLTVAKLGESRFNLNARLKQLKYLGINLELKTLSLLKLKDLQNSLNPLFLEAKLAFLFREVRTSKKYPNTRFSFYSVEDQKGENADLQLLQNGY